MFEKHSFKSKADLKYQYTIGFSGSMLDYPDSFFIRHDVNGFEEDYSVLATSVKSLAKEIFEQFNSIKDVYNHSVKRMVEDEHFPFRKEGADWVFESLTMVKIVEPEKYPYLKNKLLPVIEDMVKRKEPNMIEYYPKLNMILEDLESQVFHTVEECR